ncbi:glycosyltransferase family 2 protein [Mesorhizobium sp. 10J20-29]
MARMTVPPGCRFTVIVVTSGCSDPSADGARDFKDRLPITVLEERHPGLSRARNRGLSEINSDAVVFIDDDATVHCNLLSVYCLALEQYPAFDFFAGAVLARLEGKPRPIIEDVARILPTTFSQLWLGPDPRPLDPSAFETPFGANFAIRRKAICGQRFDENFGRRGNGNLDGGEEVRFFSLMSLAGSRGLWLPDARVDHWIDTGRQNMDYVRKYWISAGALQMQLEHYSKKDAQFPFAKRAKMRLRYWFYRGMRRRTVWLVLFRELMLERGRLSATSIDRSND